MRHWLASLVLVGCGSVSSNPMDAPKSDTVTDTTSVDTAPTCGAAGQMCCASNMCNTGLTCTTGDQVCRATTTFVLGQDTSNNAFVAMGSGTTFTPTTLGAGQPVAIWGTSPSDVWVTVITNPGASAQVTYARHYNGTSWEPVVGLGTGSGLVYGVWGSAANNYWGVNNAGNSFHWTGSSWGNPQAIMAGVVYTQIWGSAASDVWALGGNSISHFDGANWSTTTRSDFSVSSRLSISGLKATGEWYSGGGVSAGPVVLHRSGTTFTVEPTAPNATCSDTKAVWTGPDDVYGVIGNQLDGTAGCPALVHRENGAWVNKAAISTAANITTMWGTSNKDLYAAGKTAQGPALFHFDGTIWTPVYTPASVNFLMGGWSTGNPN